MQHFPSHHLGIKHGKGGFLDPIQFDDDVPILQIPMQPRRRTLYHQSFSHQLQRRIDVVVDVVVSAIVVVVDILWTS